MLGVVSTEGFFTVIRRGTDGKLKTVPYNVEYKTDLAHVAKLLKDAAASTDNASLKKFLAARAESLAAIGPRLAARLVMSAILRERGD